MNTLVDAYRQQVPNDPRSDQELTIAFGRQNEIDGRYKDYPDLISQYNALKNPQPEPSPFPPPMSAEFRKGVSAGASSLKSSYLGLGSLAADSIGADGLAQALRQKYEESQAEEAAQPPTVGKVEDIHSASDALRYGLRKAGEFVPNVAEALGFSAAGAAAGSAVGPEGTAGGAGAALLEGFLERSAAKSILKTMVEQGAEKLGLNEGAAAVVKDQLGKVAAGEAVTAFDAQAGRLLQSELKAKASKLGMEAANFANFGALGAGGEYPAALKAGADKDDAATAAAIAGLGSSMGALLPNFAFGKMFPGLGEQPAKDYVARLALDAAKEIPMASSGMGLMEVANIAAERYADPSKRGTPLTDDEKSRILNAAVVGGMMGAAAAPLSAIPGGARGGEKPPPQTFDPAVEQHFSDVPQERRDQIAELKARIEGKQAKETDMAQFQALSPAEKNFYAVAKPPELPGEESGSATPEPANEPGPAEPAATSPPTTPTKSAEAQPSGLVSSPVTTADKQQQDLQAKRAAAVVTTAPSNPMAEAVKARVEAAAKQTDPTPSLAQKLAGNYEKGHVDGADLGIPGVQIAIENPAGTERVDTGGKWQTTMPDHYGQILGTKGKDGDPIDIHIGPNPTAPTVFVVDQVDPKTGAFDEHKTFLGFESQVQAEAAYDAGFSDGTGPSRRGAVTAMSKDEFKAWVKDDKATKEPLKYAETIRGDQGQLPAEGKVAEVSQANSGHDLEQAAPGQPEPVGKGKEEAINPQPSGETAVKNLPSWAREEMIRRGLDPNRPLNDQDIQNPSVVEAIKNDPTLTPDQKAQILKTGSPTAPKTEPAIKPEQVAVETKGTVAESGRGKKGGTATVEPAWFRPKGDESLLKMSDKLLSDSSPPSGSEHNNSESYRVAAIQDRQTGKVHLVSVFENNDEARVTKFTNDLGRKNKRDKSLALTDVLRAKTEDGSDRYKVIGSARLGELKEYVHDQYPDVDTFEREFAEPVEEMQKATQRGAEVMEDRIRQEIFSVPSSDDEKTTGTFEPEPLNLEDHEVKMLAERMPKIGVDELADMIGRGAIPKDLMDVITKVAMARPDFFERAEEIGTAEALKLKEYGGYETDTGPGRRVEPGTPEKPRGNLPNDERRVAGGEGGPKTNLEGGENRTEQTEQAEPTGGQEGVEGGNAEPNPAAGEEPVSAEPDVKQRLPGPQNEPHDPEAERLVNSIHEAAARAGMDIQRIAGDIRKGAYDPKTRTLYQVIGDTVGKQDVKTAFHEVGHDVFANEPADVRARLLRGVDRLSDDALGVDTSADTRIRAADPAGLGKEGVNEERLVESTAEKLSREGFNPDEAKGFAQKFVRALKDFYLKAAMQIQKWLKFDENPKLAQRYFENRVKQLLGGDRQGMSYVDFVGAGKDAVGKRYSDAYQGSKDLGERLSASGDLEYDHVPDDSLAGSRFNLDAITGLKWNLPEDERFPKETRQVEIEKRAAILNHRRDSIKLAADAITENPQIATDATKFKGGPEAYVRRLLNISDPEEAKKLLAEEKERSGLPVPYDAEKTIEGFNAKPNTDAVAKSAYQNAQSLLSKVGIARTKSTDSIDELQSHIEGRQARLQAATDRLNEVLAAKEDKTKVVEGIDKLEKKFKGQVAQAKREIAADNKQIAKEKAKVTALDTMFPVLYKEQAKLAGKLDIGSPFTVRDGAAYNVPEKPDSSNADVMNGSKTLRMDSTGAVTNPLEVEDHLRKMNAWLANRRAKEQAGDEDALDNVYQGVKRQYEELAAYKNFRVDVAPAHRWMSALGLMPVGRRMAEAFGTPAARFIDKMINHYNTVMESMHPFNERFGRRNDQLENDLLKMTLGMDRDYLRNNVLDKAKRKAMDQHDLEEAYANDPNKLRRAIMSRIKETLLSDKATGKHIGPVADRYMPALEKLLQHQFDANQWQIKNVEAGRTGVLDTKLKAVNPATGKTETAVRRAVPVGAFTFSQKFHPETPTMIKAMRASDWDSMADIVPTIAEKYNEEGPEAVLGLLKNQFNTAEHSDQVQRKFFRSLAEMDTNSPFFAPSESAAEEEGGSSVRSPADPARVKEALEAADYKDPVAFAEKLHELYGETGDKGQFVQDTIGRMGEIYREINNIYRQFEPTDKAERTVAIRGMTPDAMIDARRIEHLPSEWFSYHSFDQRDMFNTSQRIASQTAFGRGQERLASAFDTVKSEVDSAKTRLDEARQAVKEANPDAKPKEFEKLMAERLGADEYEKLQQQDKRSSLLMSSVRGLSDFFRKDNSPDGTLKAMTRFAHALGSLLVNQPASAINQMEQLFALNLKYGASGSTLGATARIIGTVGKEAAASLAQAIGIQMSNEGEFQRLYTDLGLTDPTVMKSWHDAFDRLQGEGRASQFFRGLDDLMGVGVNRSGDEAKHIVFRPLQPFTWSAMLADRAITEGVWQMAKSHLGRGLEFYRNNPDKLKDNAFKLDSKSLGLKGQGKDTFERFTSDMERWGLNYDDMVRGSMERADGKPFTNEEALKLYSMAVSEVVSESNLSTMAPGAYNNSVLRVVTPLLGWGFRRAQQVAQLGLNEDGQRDMVKLGRAMGGLAVMSAGGLAVSGLVNQYSENLLGKKRNLRPLVGPDAKETALGIMENLNRVGTLGLFGELLNGVVNVGTGQDNRVVSLDERIVAVNAMMSIQSAISSFVNQGFQADYAHVVRPLATSLGAGGMLQYMQLANHTLGLDNPESRMVARTNAQNWLRAVGRDLNMDVRESGGGGGGFSNATPVSPALTKMELAAYGNSPGDFQEAYHEAIKAAKDLGNPDPVDYVKRAYAARNPLRQVFRTSPSEAEYKRILAALPENGRRDVDQAVDFYNEYAEQIGARPFEGKPEKPAGKIMGAKFGLPKLVQNQKRNAALEGMLAP